MDQNIASGFWESLQRFPERPALNVGRKEYSYRELSEHATRIAKAVEREAGDAAVVGLLAERSITTYGGILGILATGRGY